MAKANKKSTSSPAAAQQDKDLQLRFEEARDVLAGSESGSTLANYKVGAIAQDVKNGKKYGDGALEKFGEKIGIDHKTLYDYVDVVKVWPQPKEFKELAAKPNKKGWPLTWSHFMALAHVPDPKARDSFMKLALQECMTVRALKKAIGPAGASTATKAPKRTEVDATPATALGHLAQLVANVTVEARLMGVGFPAALAASRATWSSEEREKLRKTAEELLKMTAELFGMAQGIEQVLKTSDTAPAVAGPSAYAGEVGPIEPDEDEDNDLIDEDDSDDASVELVTMAASAGA